MIDRVCRMVGRSAMRVPWPVPAILVLLGVTGCSPTDAETPLEIWTDRDEYELQRDGERYWVEIDVQVGNPRDRTVYLHRTCGDGDEPGIKVRRPSADSTLRAYGTPCSGVNAIRKPIPVEPGEAYHYQLVLEPRGGSRASMLMRTGPFMLVYAVQRSDSVGGWGPVDPLPEVHTTSNVFHVNRPAD